MTTSLSWNLPGGGVVAATPVSGGFSTQLYGPDGRPEGASFSAIQPSLGSYTAQSVTVLAGGGYVLAYTYVGALLPGSIIDSATFSADGALLTQSSVSSSAKEAGEFPASQANLYALPDGGFVALWTDAAAYSAGASQLVVREFNADGVATGDPQVMGLAGGGPTAQVNPDGSYVVSWTSFFGPQQETFKEQASPLVQPNTAAFVDPAPVALTPSAGWTSAAVLSNHTLAVVDAQSNGNGWLQGAERTYDANGNETASTSLMGGGQTLAPEITALPVGGFYEVTYAGSSNYEVYNANDQMVFVHNQWTSPTEAFSPLLNGGYVTTDSASGVFGLFDAGNNPVGWFAMPSDAPGTPTVNALNGGGFVFTYAGTNHFDLYDASGNLLEGGAFSASGSEFAQGFAPLAGNGNGFVEAWLSPDGSTANGLATSLDIQAMGPHGAITPAITLAQDLDPWGTTFKLESHADGSVAVLWSQGGAVFGAEYANGQAGPAHGALPGDLSTTVAVQLPNDMEGFAWLMNGDAWAEIFNPATGQVQSADLGPSSSADISSVHALATAQGGVAVSWREGSAVMGAVIDASGHLATMPGLAGDLLGVNAAGQAITLHDNGAGTPVLQTYTLNDGLFWVH